MPAFFEHVDGHGSPDRATWLVTGLILILVMIGDVKLTWSFSAFTVLIYYALTNLAAIRLPVEQRFIPVIVAWFGLVSCCGLAFWVEREVWLLGLMLIAIGFVWHRLAQRLEATLNG